MKIKKKIKFEIKYTCPADEFILHPVEVLGKLKMILKKCKSPGNEFLLGCSLIETIDTIDFFFAGLGKNLNKKKKLGRGLRTPHTCRGLHPKAQDALELTP